MNRRARLVLAPVLVLAFAALLVSWAPAPASAFPTKAVYDRTVPAPGTGPLVVGDLDGDGLTDLVTVDEGTGAYSVFLQTSTGFSANPTFTFPGAAARKLIMKDMDGNGEKDLVALGTNSTWVYYRDAGVFNRTSDLKRTQGLDIDAADMNGDGKVDIAILTVDYVQLWFQNDTGSWPLNPNLNINASGFQDLWLSDLSEDGFADIVVARPHELRVFAQSL
ncbi:MAG: VCBS repeat-containing protein, partial [Methanobacteriota archaeon]